MRSRRTPLRPRWQRVWEKAPPGKRTAPRPQRCPRAAPPRERSRPSPPRENRRRLRSQWRHCPTKRRPTRYQWSPQRFRGPSPKRRRFEPCFVPFLLAVLSPTESHSSRSPRSWLYCWSTRRQEDRAQERRGPRKLRCDVSQPVSTAERVALHESNGLQRGLSSHDGTFVEEAALRVAF